MTDPLVEFVLARITEREKAASAATPGPWTLRPYWFTSPAGRSYATVEGVIYEEIDVEDGVHIALNDPAHVLARCAADRAIVELHSPAGSYLLGDDDGPRQFYCSTCGSGEPYTYPKPWPCETLRLLANANADHPGFRPEWKL